MSISNAALGESKPFTAHNKFYVTRTYSHTDLRQLWKVLSRPMQELNSANFQREYESGLPENKKHQVMLLQMVFHPDYPGERPIDIPFDPSAPYTPVGSYCVVRTHSDKLHTWKVITRGISDFQVAMSYQRLEAKEHPKHTVMVVRMVYHPDYPDTL